MSRLPWWMRVGDPPTRGELVRVWLAVLPIVAGQVRRDWKRAPR